MVRILVLLSLIAAMPLTSASAADGDVASVKAKLTQRLPNVPLDGLRPSKTVPGWYELEHGTDLLYISGDARHLFLGDLIDLETRANLTAQWRNRTAMRLLDAFGEDNMIVMGPKSPKRTITVFTDVDCPYCARLHRELPDLTANGVKVRYLMFPRAGLQSGTYRRSVAVWCAPDRVKAVGIAKAGGALPLKTCPNPVDEHYRLGRQLGVSGTPTIFLDDGRRLAGYVPSGKLLAILKLR